MSDARQVNVLNTELQLPELLFATGYTGHLGQSGLAGSALCSSPSGVANVASAGWMNARTRQASASEPEHPSRGIIDDAAAHAPFEGLEIWLSLAVLVFTVVGAVVAYLMWVSGPGFLVVFVLLLFASAPFYLKGLEVLAGIERDGET